MRTDSSRSSPSASPSAIAAGRTAEDSSTRRSGNAEREAELELLRFQTAELEALALAGRRAGRAAGRAAAAREHRQARQAASIRRFRRYTRRKPAPRIRCRARAAVDREAGRARRRRWPHRPKDWPPPRSSCATSRTTLIRYRERLEADPERLERSRRDSPGSARCRDGTVSPTMRCRGCSMR
jgi:hypothetical protein